MAEWFKAAVLKTAEGASPPWVRIPPHPPQSQSHVALRHSGELAQMLSLVCRCSHTHGQPQHGHGLQQLRVACVEPSRPIVARDCQMKRVTGPQSGVEFAEILSGQTEIIRIRQDDTQARAAARSAPASAASA